MKRTHITVPAIVGLALCLYTLPARANFDVIGKFTYENRVYDASTFTDIDTLAVRFADVEVYNVTGGANTFLKSGITDANGEFAIYNVDATTTMDIEVRCMASNRGTYPNTGRVEVKDNPGLSNYSSAAVWTMVLSVPGHVHNVHIDFTSVPQVAAIGPNPDESTGPAGAFNIFDNALRGVEEVITLAATQPRPVDILWQPGVTKTSAVIASLGEIVILEISGLNGHRDEFDDSVILHEFGHTVERSLWGGTRSPGGTHVLGQFYDPRLALSEGFATYFSCGVRNESFYLDYEAGGSLAFDIETDVNWDDKAYSSASEFAVSKVLWDIADTPSDGGDCIAMGKDEIFDVLTNYLSTLSPPASNDTVPKVMVDFYRGWKVRGHPNLDGVDHIMNAHIMEFMDTPNWRWYENKGPGFAIPGGAGLTRWTNVMDSVRVADIFGVFSEQESHAVIAYVELLHPAEIADTNRVNNQLKISLKSPQGTTVTLYDKGMGTSDADHFARGGTNGGMFTWFGLATGPALAHPWLDAVGDMRDFAGENAGGIWEITFIDEVDDALNGWLVRWGLAFIPGDWYDIPPSHGTDVYHTNSLYEWLGKGASHEWTVSDPWDSDGNANHTPIDADSLDDGVTFYPPYLPGTQGKVDVELCTSGARNGRYTQGAFVGDDDIYLRGWFDWDNDGFQDPLDEVANLITNPNDWPYCQPCSTFTFTFSVLDTAQWQGYARFRVAYSVVNPTGLEDFGEVEDYEVMFSPTGVPVVERLRNNLGQNYPNPFNPTTTIRYATRTRGHVTLRVYDIAGRLVATLVDEIQAPGNDHRVVWNGRNRRGQPVAAGVYFYTLSAPGYEASRKLVLLK